MTIEIDIDIVCENCGSRLNAEYDFMSKKLFVKLCQNCGSVQNNTKKDK